MTQRFLYQTTLFIGKQINSCLFGILLLILIVLTAHFYPDNAALSHYDFLTLMAILIQCLFLLFKFETPKEMGVILLFHLVGTLLEIFKTSVGSWQYEQTGVLFIGNVPLFAGFMYASVGSYFVRLGHLFEIRYSHFPPFGWVTLIAILAYVNFLTHHYFYDIRWILIGASLLLFIRTQLHFKVSDRYHKMPFIMALFIIATLIWIAEHIATFSEIWLYPHQMERWSAVSIDKIPSWYLLILTTLSLVGLLYPPHHYKFESA